MYLDSHIHFWRLDRGDYGWLKPENRVLYQDFTPEQALPLLQACGVRGCIAVQAAGTVAETDYLLSLARENRWIRGVVGTLDLFAPEADYAPQDERLRADPLFAGVRIGAETMERLARQDDGEALRRLRRRAQEQLPVELLFGPGGWELAEAVLRLAPELRAVVDHLGAPPYRGTAEDAQRWRESMAALASYPNVAVKLSGMITPGGDRPEPLRPYVAQLVEAYGPQRLMFGSDWPVATQKGSYESVQNLFEQTLPPGFNEAELRAVRGGTACRVYGIDEEAFR